MRKMTTGYYKWFLSYVQILVKATKNLNKEKNFPGRAGIFGPDGENLARARCRSLRKTQQNVNVKIMSLFFYQNIS